LYSPFIKVLLALLGFSPALICLWVAKLVGMYSHLRVFIRFTSWKAFLADTGNFFSVNYLLFVFLALLILTRSIVRFAKDHLQHHRFKAKQVKSVDYTLGTMLLSVALPFVKIATPSVSDVAYMIGFFIIGILYGLAMKNTHYLNLTLKIFLGYAHYEVQSTKEMTYMVLSKEPIINRDHFTTYVILSGTMLLNVSNDA